MTTNFYVPPERVRGNRVALPADEARHAARVLRLAPGAELIAVDGVGGWYRVVLDHVGASEATGHVIERRTEVGEPSYRLVIAVGLIKHRGRYETFLEKAVELGVSEIIPLITDRTEKERLRQQRAEKILIAAMKQCGRSRMPGLADPTPFEELLQRETELGLCCHQSAGREAPLMRVLKGGERPPSMMSVLVGPEGGFTEPEVEAARASGYRVISLGSRRLRTETAAIAAAACIASVYDLT